MTGHVSAADVPLLALGAGVLGAGGGGEPDRVGTILARRLGAGCHPVVALADLDPDATVVPIGIVGATQVLGEKLPAGVEFVETVAAIERWTSDRPDAVMGIEGGGLNGISGVLAAVELGLPYLDLDLMGRAMPRLDQFTWTAAGLPLTPCALAEPGGQVVVVDRVGPVALERTVRSMVSTTGGWAALALRPCRARELRDACITGSLARARRLGRAALAMGTGAPPEDCAATMGGRLLGSGRVTEVAHRPVPGGFGRGSVTVIDNTDGAVLRIESENEYLMVLVDGSVTATCPDIIALLDRHQARPVGVESVRSGIEVSVLVLSAPDWWCRRPDRLARVGPRAFGLDVDPVLIGRRRRPQEIGRAG